MDINKIGKTMAAHLACDIARSIRDKTLDTYLKAWDIYTKAQDEYNKALEAREAWDIYDEARKEYNKARLAYKTRSIK